VAPVIAPERRVYGIGDQRKYRRGGRRAGDGGAAEISSLTPCPMCRVAWAALVSFEYQRRESVAIYVCPRCGHRQNRVVVD
jgi:hypothetical protein